MQGILKSWGLQTTTCSILKAHGYNTVNHLESLTIDDVKQIFSKYGMEFSAERSLLVRKVEEWKDQRVSIRYTH